MKKHALILLLLVIIPWICIKIYAQETGHAPAAPKKNYAGFYAGLLELNLGYERNLFQFPKSFTNGRLGFGFWQFPFADPGYYLTPAVVHNLGRKNSHLELNIGIKILMAYEANACLSPPAVWPDAFVGYRYEKPEGGFVFRTGISLASLFNVGVGLKF